MLDLRSRDWGFDLRLGTAAW